VAHAEHAHGLFDGRAGSLVGQRGVEGGAISGLEEAN